MTTPFLRWAGGKRWLIEQLVPEIEATQPRCYVEPFLGAGAIALALTPRTQILADACVSLMTLWRMIQRFPEDVVRGVEQLIQQYGISQEGYLAVRERFNQRRWGSSMIPRAAQMLYLNRLCFNGLWRENSKGEMNTPYGKLAKPAFPTIATLREVSQRLRQATLHVADFRFVLDELPAETAVFADPPYHEGFVDYTAGGFSDEDQRVLGAYLQRLDARGVNVWTTNADTALIREVYAWTDIEAVGEPRAIAANGDREPAGCLLMRSRRLRSLPSDRKERR